jgi:hypothetical protein
MSSRLEQQLKAMTFSCRGIQTQYFSDDCCVAATRAGLFVLETLGVRKARPLLVAASAANGDYVRGLREPPAAYVTIDCDTTRPHCVAGHLVLVGKAGSNKFLLDLSAYQMDRPHKGIHVVGGVGITFDKSLALAGDDWRIECALSQGGRLCYGPHPDPEHVPWQRSPNWTLPTPLHRETHRKVARELLYSTACALASS